VEGKFSLQNWKSSFNYLRFQVLTARNILQLDIAPCSLVVVDRRFRDYKTKYRRLTVVV
jgi:hypothetical protein